MAESKIQMPFPSDSVVVRGYAAPSGTSETFTLSNTYRGILIGTDAGDGNKFMLLLSTSSSGTVGLGQIYKGDNITFTTATRSLTVNHASGGMNYLMITLRGSISV